MRIWSISTMRHFWFLSFVVCLRVMSTTPDTMPGHSGLSAQAGSLQEHARAAGATLVELASRDSDYSKRVLTSDERGLADECFDIGRDSLVFKGYYKEAIRAAVKTDDINTLRYLHSHHPSDRLLSDQPDILQLALKTHGQDHRWSHYDDLALHVAEVLLGYGAPVNGLDERGNMPLYYTCVFGLPDVFKALVNAGADIFARHVRYVRTDWLNKFNEFEMAGNSTALAIETDAGKVTLLQVVADALLTACGHRTVAHHRLPHHGHKKWQPIITFLMEAGLTLPVDEPATATVIELVSLKGTPEEAEMVLNKGIVSDTGPGIIDHYKSVLTSALHAAVSEGRVDAVKLLLSNGADPKDTLEYGTYGGPPEKRTAVAYACLDSYHSEFLKACEPLLDAGVDLEDQRLILKASIQQGRTETVKRLIDSGVTIDEVPHTSSLEILQYLHDKGFSLDPVKSQEHALRIGSTPMLKWLVGLFGPKLSDIRALYHSPAQDDMYGDPSHITDYLTSQYGHDVQGSQDVHAKVARKVLQYAATPERHDLLRTLLQRGKDLGCPAVRQGAYDVLKSLFRNAWFRDISRGPVLIFQTLLAFASDEDDNALDQTESDRLWLNPTSLPPDLIDDLRVDKSWSSFKWQPREDRNVVASTLSDEEDMPNGPDDGQHVEAYLAESNIEKANGLDVDARSDGASWGESCAYSTLQGMYSIRLFMLDPAEGDAPISGSLVDTHLADKPEYETVSYVLEDNDDLVHITVNDSTHSVPHNLHAALMRLRKPNETRSLWADAICVNHMDMQERNHQASIMKRIIESAINAMIWLGEEADDNHLVFSHIKEWTTYCEDYAAGRRTDNDAFDEKHINPPHYEGETLEALRKLALRPWFFQVRNLQDLVLSKKAYLMCGNDVEDFRLIVLPMSFHRGTGYDPLHGIDGPTHLHNLDDIGRQYRGHRVKSLLQYTSLCDATDPRDQVFALLDLFSERPMDVDYNLTVEEVYRRFSQTLLEDSNDLHLLHWLGTQRRIESLPSWVPDYSTARPVGILPRVNGWSHTSNEVSRLLEHCLPGMRFEEDKMIVRGVNLETITAISDEMVASPTHAPGKPGFLDVLSKWESLATQLQSKRFIEPVSGAFLRTLAAFDPQSRLEGDVPLSPHHAVWYDEYGSGLLRSFDEPAFKEADIMLEWLGGKYQDGWQDVQVSHFTRAIEQAVYSRRFFLTDSGSMGLAPPRAEPGDSIVYFPGGLYPFVLRPRDAGFEMIGDCYLYDFDEFQFSIEEINGFGEFVLV